MGYDANAYLDGLPPDAIGELHLGGFTREEDEATPGSDVLIDTHATRVAEPAWNLYAYAVRRFGRRPTLIEWDNEIPDLSTLLGEARRANDVAAGACEREASRAAC